MGGLLGGGEWGGGKGYVAPSQIIGGPPPSSYAYVKGKNSRSKSITLREDPVLKELVLQGS